VRTLSDHDVRLIVELFHDLSISVKEIAEKFEVSPSLVEGITRREIYVDVTKRLKIERRPRGRHKLDREKVRNIRSLRADGWTIQRIAKHYAVSYPTVSQILSGRTWAFVE
jgi:Mn-dependent DtxR family transcriptional regulator